ncbi:hypothetical protein B5F40_02975 [Gordonibacter sp. An230]|uniref:glycosyltransferase family 4 protein n=1 Tax=Gordonibacter sp. An230 TaxID=1965592 RepID=UPI000B370738|nr:glycosyltransferase family 4 protein [Gordonibacter sp. An230]OUO91811.1 hypothetical protein B5F40_02975 [Gordonibacter sp. An230]
MRILAVCQHYWPEDFQVTAVCEDLAARGHDVTVLAGLPNYPSGVVPPEYRRGGRRREERGGVSIVRAWEVGRRPGALGLAANYYSFALSAKRLAGRLDDGFDVVFAYQLSPVMMAVPAVAYKRLHGAPLLLYCCDLWPESMKVMIGERFPWLLERYRRVSKEIYAAADVIAVQSSAFCEYFERVHSISGEAVRYVPQFASDEYLGEDFSREPSDRVNLVLMGNMGRAQNLPVVVSAFARMRNRDRATLHLVGDGACLGQAKRLAAELGVGEDVVFHGRRPYSEMPRYYRMADACVLSLSGDSWVGATLPSRLQGYMAAGKPVLAAIGGGARWVIEESGCGRAVDPGDVEGYASIMDEFVEGRSAFDGCGERGRAYFAEHFTRARHVDAIEGMLEELAEGGTR